MSRQRIHAAVCQQCGETFERRGHNRSNLMKFCSQKCNSDYQTAADPDRLMRLADAGRSRAASIKGTGKHGIHRYNRFGCRCGVCKAAAKVYNDRNRKPVPPKHGVRRYRKFGCRCDVCCAAERKSYEKAQAKWARSNQRLTAETIEQAHRWGYQWTGPELELAARSDLTAIQVAKMIGRTAHAVKHKRRQLLDDPRAAALAGTELAPTPAVVVGPEVAEAVRGFHS